MFFIWRLGVRPYIKAWSYERLKKGKEVKCGSVLWSFNENIVLEPTIIFDTPPPGGGKGLNTLRHGLIYSPHMVMTPSVGNRLH